MHFGLGLFVKWKSTRCVFCFLHTTVSALVLTHSHQFYFTYIHSFLLVGAIRYLLFLICCLLLWYIRGRSSALIAVGVKTSTTILWSQFVESIILFAWDSLTLPHIGMDSVCLSVWVPLDTCVCVFVQLLRHVLSLAEIYECHFSAQLYVDSSHGQYMLVWKIFWCWSSLSLLA